MDQPMTPEQTLQQITDECRVLVSNVQVVKKDEVLVIVYNEGHVRTPDGVLIDKAEILQKAVNELGLQVLLLPTWIVTGKQELDTHR